MSVRRPALTGTRATTVVAILLAMLASGKSPEEVLKLFAHRLTNKLIHAPSVQLKQAGYDGRNEIIDVVRTIFDIKDSEL